MKDLRYPTTSSTTVDKDDESKANTSSSQNVDVEDYRKQSQN